MHPASRRLSPAHAILLPCAFAAGLFSLLLLPPLRTHPVLLATFVGAGCVLVLWAAALYAVARRTGRPLMLEIVLRKNHYIQACAQLTLLLYWGWHVRPVYAYLPFIVAQLLFAYGLDSLLNWSRRRTHQLGLGPFPVVLSINFFLWFKFEWFYWQFVIVALGFAAKEFIRWSREGRSAHIFNPSSFPLAVFSLVLIVTGTTNATFGLEIASTLFNPPHMYMLIFLVALPAQIVFGVTTMSISAVLTAYVWGLFYFAATGTYYFRDAFIPIAVFLGMLLLFTDPSTSPRTEAGRVIFGVLYASSTIALAGLLEAIGAPTFYDKLLPIPILNLLVRRIDRVAASAMDRIAQLRLFVPPLTATRYRLSVVGLWVVTFLGMSTVGAVGDNHRGQYLPFWRQACDAGSARACEYLVIMQERYCERGSGWACNELAVQQAEQRLDRAAAMAALRRACDLEFRAACGNVIRVTNGERTLARARPGLRDLPIVLRGSKGPIRESTPRELYALACARGWVEVCAQRSAEAEP